MIGFSFAQAADVIIRKSNENPKEGETVKLTLESDKYNLSNAKITWYVDGNESDSGVGRRTFSVLMQNQNPVQVISVSVQEEGLDDSQAQIILEISGEILLYEGYNSTVPLFYKGRSLPGKEGAMNVQLMSFKDGEITDFRPSQFSNVLYTWKINGQEKPELGGVHKAQNVLQTRVVDSGISVQILKQDENSGKESRLNIPLQQPEILMYKLSENKLTKTIVKDTEIGKSLNLSIEPFFFSTNNKYSTDLKYTWKINNQENSISTPWFISFSGTRSETVKINLDINNSQKITQKASRGFTYKVE